MADPDRRDKTPTAQCLELEHIFRTAPVGLCLMDTELRFVRINDELAALDGKSVEDHIGHTLRHIVPEIADILEDQYREVFATGRPQLGFEVRGSTAEKSTAEKTFQVSLYPVCSDHGEVMGVSTVVVEITSLKRVQDDLRRSEEMLREQSRTLERKNAALKELLEQIEFEKKQIKDDILSNIYELIHPVLQKLKQRCRAQDKIYLDLLEHNLEELVAPFGKRISDKRWSLSPREKEVCNMIRDGLSSKEIAGALSTSTRTIDNQRMSIRKKLGIAHKSVNLTTFLQSL